MILHIILLPQATANRVTFSCFFRITIQHTIENQDKSKDMNPSEIKALKLVLIAIAIGIWVNVILTWISIRGVQKVDMENTVRIRGTVNVDNTVDISGKINIDNMLDVNIKEINGYDNAFYRDSDGAYILLPVHAK